MTSETHRSGFVAVVGRPNVGKSTLVNALVGEKISIVTRKPQTTRHSITGIIDRPDCQLVLVDTPGLHAGGGRLINRTMNRSAGASLAGADVAMFVVEATGWQRGDDFVLERICAARLPAVLVVNKIDLVRPREHLLPRLADYAARHAFAEIVPIAARRADNVERLPALLCALLPEGPALYPAGSRTDRSRAFRVGEVVREQLLLNLHQEVPYGLAVELESLEDDAGLLRARVTIWVDRESQVGMVVGAGGEMLRRVGSAARRELETLFGQRFHLETRARVKANWSDNARALRQLGYDEVP